MHRQLAFAALLILRPSFAGADEPLRKDTLGDPLPPGALARVGTTRLVHLDGFASVAFSPDASILATGGETRRNPLDAKDRRGTILFWDTRSGKKIRQMVTPDFPVRSLAFSSDGKRLAAACGARVCVWALADGGLVLEGTHKTVAAVLSVRFSLDGRRVISTHTPAVVRTWDLETKESEAIWETRPTTPGASNPTIADLSPDGSLVAVAAVKDSFVDPESELLVIDASSKRTLRKIGPLPGRISRLAFHPSLPRAAVSTEQGTRVLDLEEGSEVWFAKSSGPRGVRFSPDGKLLSTSAYPQTSFHDAQTGEVLSACPYHGPEVLAFSADSRLLAYRQENAVRMWDVKAGRHHDDLPGVRSVAALQFRPDGKLVAQDLWTSFVTCDPKSGKTESRADGVPWKSPSPAALSTVGGLYVVHQGDTLELRDLAGKKKVRDLAVETSPKRQYDYTHSAFSADGALLVLGGRDLKRLFFQTFDVASGKLLAEFPRQETKLFSSAVEFSPDGKLLLVANQPGFWDVVDPRSGDKKGQLSLPREVIERDRNLPYVRSFAAGWTYVAVAPERDFRGAPPAYAISVLHLEESRLLRQIFVTPEVKSEPAEIQALALFPDGRQLAVVMRGDKTIRVFETATGKERGRLPGHEGTVFRLAFSPDGKTLASSASDATVLLWDVRRPYAGKAAAGPLTILQLLNAWEGLAAADATVADEAIWDLVAAGDEAVAFLKVRLAPAKHVDAALLRELLDDVNSEKLAVRDKALKRLFDLGEPVLPGLHKALAAGKFNLEAKRRLEIVVAGLEKLELTADDLRLIRAIEVLERLPLPASEALLERLASGAETWATRTALESLARWRRGG